MKYRINGVNYTKRQLENILGGAVAKYCDEEGNPIVEFQDAALLALEQGSSFTSLTFDEAMIQSRIIHTEEE
tara:strand:- start:855 stop:1070 length:216 start_codon:yes stop_codon:yes gene_type:complete